MSFGKTVPTGWGVIGIGPNIEPKELQSIARRNAIPGIIKAGDLVAVKTRDRANARDLQEIFPDLKVYEDLGSFLADPNVRYVYIGTPPGDHYKQACEALEAGKHVIGEKPLALTPIEASRIVELAKEKRRLLDVAHVLPYHPAFSDLKKIMSSKFIKGNAGEIQSVDIRMLFPKIASLEEKVWYLQPRQGGIFRDMFTHVLSMIYFLFGDTAYPVLDLEPAKLTYESSGRQFAVDVAAEITGRINNKITLFAKISWIASEAEKQSSIVIQGEQENSIKLDMLSWNLENPPHNPISYTPQNLFGIQLANLMAAVERKNELPIYHGRIGLRAVEIIDRVYQAIPLQQSVTVIEQSPREKYLDSVKN